MLNQGLEDYLTILFYFKSVMVLFVYMHFDLVNVMELEACTSVFMVPSV